MKQVEWKITNRRLDGTEIKPGEKIPLTPEAEAVFCRVADIVKKAATERREIA